jgi:hypothetical protein
MHEDLDQLIVSGDVTELLKLRRARGWAGVYERTLFHRHWRLLHWLYENGCPEPDDPYLVISVVEALEDTYDDDLAMCLRVITEHKQRAPKVEKRPVHWKTRYTRSVEDDTHPRGIFVSK